MLVAEEHSSYVSQERGKKVIGATIYIKDSHGDWIVWSFKVFPAILFFGFCASVNYPLEPLEFDERINSYAFYI